MSFCSNCGSSINPTDTFCNSCGEQVKSAKPTNSDEPVYQPPNTARSSRSQPTYGQPKKYLRSPDNKVIAGVCGGLSEYFDIDPVLVRVGFALFAIFGAGVIAYIMLAILVPERART